MLMWCLIKEKAQQFRKALKSGDLNIADLVGMSTKDRRAVLAKFVGEENAKNVNTLFESKLILKNQEQGLMNWIKKSGRLDEKETDTLLTKIRKLNRALSPKEKEQILSDIVEKRLKISPTEEQAKFITDTVKEMESIYKEGKPLYQQEDSYIKLKQKLISYIREQTPEFLALSKSDYIKKIPVEAMSLWRSLKTGFDLSFPGRQGEAYIGTKEWRSAFKNMFSYAKSPIAMDELEIKMMKNKYFQYAEKYKRDLGLTLLGEKMTQREEQYATKLAGKIPLLGGSERAFVGFSNDLRFNRFANILEQTEKAGVKITENPEAMKDLAQTIAAASGRGNLGKWELAARPLATALFSPRWLISRFQVIFNPFTKTGVARKEAISSLARLAGVWASVYGLYKMAGIDIETDPTSSKFGKVKMGKTYFDVSAGTAPIITLFSRIALRKEKTDTGDRKLNTGQVFGKTTFDVALNFFTNKTSPGARVIIDLLKGRDFDGNKLSPDNPKGLAKYFIKQTYPLITQDIVDVYKGNSGDMWKVFAGAGLATFGIQPITYDSIVNWDNSTGKELMQFKEKVGEDTFKKANDEYNQSVDEKKQQIIKDERYKKLSDEEKQKVITKMKNQEKDKIFRKYKFKYKQEKSQNFNQLIK